MPFRPKSTLDAGYTIISIDYRLAPQAKLNDIIEDLVDAYRWVRIDGPKLFRIDPNRIAVVGHSAGGYLTLMAGFRLNPRPAALVSFYGYGDIAGDWYSRPDPFYSRQPAVPKEEAYQAVGTLAHLRGSRWEPWAILPLYAPTGPVAGRGRRARSRQGTEIIRSDVPSSQRHEGLPADVTSSRELRHRRTV